MVPRAGLEPARTYVRQILSLMCLPISPPRHISYLDLLTSFNIVWASFKPTSEEVFSPELKNKRYGILLTPNFTAISLHSSTLTL